MGTFNKIKSSPGPYAEDATNLIYELLFCDELDLYKKTIRSPELNPWKILFDEKHNLPELQKIILDENTESRIKLLAYKKLQLAGELIEDKVLEGVIVEVGLDNGLDVLASYRDGTARYINYTGKMLIWEANDETSSEITAHLFRDSENIVASIGPWNKPRLPHPVKGNVRITFLTSNGIYFGEGEARSFFNDPLASPALQSATALMQHIISVQESRK
ncbi:MAG: hypothetical protein ABJC12_14170 [Saprospiraceae bacterium]